MNSLSTPSLFAVVTARLDPHAPHEPDAPHEHDDAAEDTVVVPPDPLPTARRAERLAEEARAVPMPVPMAIPRTVPMTQRARDLERRVARAFDAEPDEPARGTLVMHIGRLLAPSPVAAWQRRATRAKSTPPPPLDPRAIALERGPGSTLVVRSRTGLTATETDDAPRAVRLAVAIGIGLLALAMVVALAGLGG